MNAGSFDAGDVEEREPELGGREGVRLLGDVSLIIPLLILVLASFTRVVVVRCFPSSRTLPLSALPRLPSLRHHAPLGSPQAPRPPGPAY